MSFGLSGQFKRDPGLGPAIWCLDQPLRFGWGCLGVVEAHRQTHGQYTGVGGDYQSDQHFGLAEGGNHGRSGNRNNNTIVCCQVATVGLLLACCHSS